MRVTESRILDYIVRIITKNTNKFPTNCSRERIEMDVDFMQVDGDHSLARNAPSGSLFLKLKSVGPGGGQIPHAHTVWFCTLLM